MASASSSSSLAPCERASQSSFTEGDLPGSFETLPFELILNIFKFLGLEELVETACVSRQFQRLARDRSLWQESELKFRFPLIKNIFNKQAWDQIIDLGFLEGVNFGAEKPFNPASAVKALKDIHRLKVESYTVITMPQGLTINKLKSIIARFAAEGRFPAEAGQEAPGFRYFGDRISVVLGDVPVAESYTFAISNAVLMASRNKTYNVQRDLVRAAEGCELPQVLEAMTLLFLTYMASGERQERLFNNDIRYTYMRCLERIDGRSLSVGGFDSSGLDVYDSFDFGFFGAGGVRKFL